MTRIRQSLSFLTALVLAFLCVSVAVPARAANGDFGIVYNSSSVNLRSQPNQYSDWLGSYPSGTWLEINGESGNWYYVSGPDGKTGYMSKNFVRVPGNSYGTIVIVDNPKETSFLNMREQPSYSARVVDYFYNSTPGVVLGYQNGWYYVNVNGKIGYLRSEYVYEVANVAYSNQVGTVVTANGGALNMRYGPGSNYSVRESLKNGTYVMVLEKGTTWWKVSVGGSVGYVMSSFMKDGIVKRENLGSVSGSTGSGTSSGGSSGSTSYPGTTSGYAIVTNPRPTQLLNLREEGNTSSRVLGQYKNGTRLTMLEQGSVWCKVRVDATGKVGYMMTRYLTLNNLPAVPTAVVTHPQRTFVNLRTAPSMNTGRIVTRMNHGSEVMVLEPGTLWTKVCYNGTIGYAMTCYLK